MIDANTRKAAYALHLKGKSERKIANILSISRSAVRTAIRHKGEEPSGKNSNIECIDEDH
jgi:transposase